MVHSLTLNYMDKVSQLIFLPRGEARGGVRLVCSCSLRVAVPFPPPDKGKTENNESEVLLSVFSLCWGEGAATRRLSQLPLFESAL